MPERTRHKVKRPHPQYFKTADDLVQKIPDEDESGWPEEVVDGINKSLKSAHAIAEETYGRSSSSEIKSIELNIGSPWKLMANFTGNYTNGVDSGTGTFTSSCRWMKHYDGSVEFQGSYSGPTAPGYPGSWWLPHTLGTLQPRLRPPFNLVYPIYGFQNPASFQATPAYVSILTTGVMQVAGVDGLGLTPASSAPAAFTINVRYMSSDSRPLNPLGLPAAFKIKSNNPPLGVIPIACVDLSQSTVRPGPMVANADWEFSRVNGESVVTINNLAFSGWNNRIRVWFLVVYK